MRRLSSVLFCALIVSAFAADTRNTYHQDHRASFAKLSFVKNAETPAGLTGEDQARDYLSQHAAAFGLASDLHNLSLLSVRRSLLGDHYTYQQYLAGHKVVGGTIVVSISLEDGQVYRVYNNTYPESNTKRIDADASFSDETALDLAWDNLRVHGRLLLLPSVELVYLPEGEQFRLVYRTEVGTEAPFGYWGHTIDAKSGEILDVTTTSLNRKDIAFDFSFDGSIWDRAETTAAFLAEQAQDRAKLLVATNGSGQVFDPDPVTTLQNSGLSDTSSASSFTAAYFTRTLQDINVASGTYSLTGPWVQIANFETPNTAPTTTTTGAWTGTRGNQQFNDAMTYFHIDQNQRYMQSLGFTGATGIQYGSIQADADGLSGADNSHFVPSSNRIAFGKGCVDDNEDAFVILHEYGHAIHFSINSNWSGGDTGAMGEGFGDYWAGSYKYSTPNGPTFQPNWAFPWDGHNACWGGRLLNNTGQYDPTKTYGAHATVNGVSTDELWSSPLFQALRRLDSEASVPREEVDQIILEAHFGIASGPKMRDMAAAIVATAESLYPAGPHADILREEFEARNILAAAGGPTTSTFTGTVAKNGTANHTISVSGGAIALSLTWSGTNNLNLNLYNPSGVKVASATTSSKPETINYTATVAGSYRLEVVNTNTKKSASYTLTATYTP